LEKGENLLKKIRRNVKQLDRHFHFIASPLFVALLLLLALPPHHFLRVPLFLSPLRRLLFSIAFLSHPRPPFGFLIDRIGERCGAQPEHQSQSAAGQRNKKKKISEKVSQRGNPAVKSDNRNK